MRNQVSTLQAAFTLIELLVVIGVITVLMSLLLPALALVRRQAATASARQTLKQVALCIESYRSGDAEHRYPPVQSDSALALRAPSVGSLAVLALLDRQGLPVMRANQLDNVGRLIDPWGQPYRYELIRPMVSDPGSLTNWNYDPVSAHERAWGRRWDAGANAITEGSLPFAYLYSLGSSGLTDNGAGWIYIEDTK